MWQALTRHEAASGGRQGGHTGKFLTTLKCHRRDRRTECPSKEASVSKRTVDRSFRL